MELDIEIGQLFIYLFFKIRIISLPNKNKKSFVCDTIVYFFRWAKKQKNPPPQQQWGVESIFFRSKFGENLAVKRTNKFGS